jgi:aryl carrier-like protein
MQSNRTSEPPTLDDLREAIAALTGLEPHAVPEDANLIQLGVDSLGMMRLVNRWRRARIKVSYRELAAEPTLAAWRRYLDVPDGQA